ncbi:MAG: SSS family solute:Na+ symporter [Saprospiraceae bacterium]|jgi:SSS family solute:Na+ symporter
MNNNKLICSLFFLILLLSGCQEPTPPEERLQEDAQKILSQILHHQKQWVKVHAAEFLIDLGEMEAIDSIFQKENELYGNAAPYRVGIWRVLSQIDSSNYNWKVQIVNLAKDSKASDQLYAIETIAKRKIPPLWLSYWLKNQILHGDNIRLKSYTQWALAIPRNEGDKPAIDSLKRMVFSKIVEEKRIAALALGKLNYYPEEAWNELATHALKEPSDSDAKVYLLAAGMTLCPDQKLPTFGELEKEILSYNNSYSKTKRYVLCETLARTGDKKHLRILKDLMYGNNPILNIETLGSPQEHPVNIDVSAAAAYAILKISARM